MQKKYEKEGVTIVWKPELCQHAAECVKGSPNVFKPKDKPWIQPEGDSKENIINTVKRCPSGALSIQE